jgi:transposase
MSLLALYSNFRKEAVSIILAQRGHRGGPIRSDREAYRRRSIIGSRIGWLEECRRIATRFEKLALNLLGIIKEAITQRYANLAFSDRA